MLGIDRRRVLASARRAGAAAGRKRRPQQRGRSAEADVPAAKTPGDAVGAEGGAANTRSISARVSGSGDAARDEARTSTGGRQRRRPPRQARDAAGRATAARRQTAPLPASGGLPSAPGERTEERVRMSKRRATIAQAAGRGAEHRRDADDVQRGRHDGGDGAARAPQAGVQGAVRRRPRASTSFFVKAVDRRAARVPAASTPRSRATRWC